MKAYVVGGAVRDGLLGQPVHDRDWVVVGASPEALLAAGYRAVGRDFPVFLHPQTGEQYALARTERKSAAGYHGFQIHAAPDVTLEQDLARRDLTINAMALDPDSGAVVDPFGGQDDLRAKVLRHVSPAFAEDPVRLLRLARFSARWPDFSVAPDTQALMRRLVEAGEVDALVPERVWQEVSRGLMERMPSRMFDVLRGCGALARLAPELDAPLSDGAAPRSDRPLGSWAAIDASARAAESLEVRFACLCHELGDPAGATVHTARAEALCARWRVDNECRELALLVLRERAALQQAAHAGPGACLALLERCDAWRRPERFDAVLRAVALVTPPGASSGDASAVRLRRALKAARQVSVDSLRAQGRLGDADGPAIGLALRAARVQAITEAFAGA
jgi:tRNA nucleotidyltransferase (CCA-adding enzyme)